MADQLDTVDDPSISSLPAPAGKVDPTALQREVHRLRVNVKVTAAAQFARSHAWSRFGLILNVATASLVALVGVSQLADLVGPVPAGIGALAAAGLVGVGTALAPDKKAASAAEAANAYIEIRDALWQLAALDLPSLTPQEARTQIKLFTDRIHAVHKTADPPGRLARRKAKKTVFGRLSNRGQPQASRGPSR